MRGITKLKMGLVIILVIEIIAVFVSFIGVSISDMETTDFIKELSYAEQNQISQLYSNYPDYHSSTILSISGLLLYLSVGMTAFLLYKVWNKQKIE